jgi:hypothetical protein
MEITADEIIAGLMVDDSDAAKDAFRFNLCYARHTDGIEPEEIVALDWSGQKLTVLRKVAMERLVHLQQLNVSGNCIDDAALVSAGLDALPIVHLDVSKNKVRDLCGPSSQTCLQPHA